MTVKLSQAQLDAILNDAGRILKNVVSTETARLAKSDDNDADDKGPPPEGSAPPDDQGPPSGPPPDDQGPPMGDDQSGEDPMGDPAQDDQESPESLKAEYAQLDLDRLKMHAEAAQAALAEAMQSQGGGDMGGPPAPPAGPAGPPPAGPPPDMMNKSEKALKAELEALKKSNARLQKDHEKVISSFGEMSEKFEKILSAFATAPVKKSEVKVNDPSLKKSQSTTEISPDVAKEKLRGRLRDQSLTKNERDKINLFFLNRASVADVAHLIK